MSCRLWKAIISLFLFTQIASAGLYSNKGENVVVYWGQGANQESLGAYCQHRSFSVVVISFLNNWNSTAASFNFGNACWDNTCPQIEQDIQTCQSLGIKVLLSLGGDATLGNYGVDNDNEGKLAANVIYKMFNPHSNSEITKPFGKAEIDGFDFDIENNRPNGLGALAAELRTLWTSKKLLISATPQCIYPDGSVQKLLEDEDAKVDFAFVQFYNNPACSLNNDKGFRSAWDTWQNFTTHGSGNTKNMKLFLGVCTACDQQYIIDIDKLKNQTTDQRNAKNFGGFTLWEVSSAYKVVSNNLDYVSGLQYIIKNKALPTDSPSKREVILNTVNPPSTTLSTLLADSTPLQKRKVLYDVQRGREVEVLTPLSS